ncbi:MAG: DUF1844 domain-containing protein [Candidatus Zixiibacteriota bacterium]|nr:MAG: DUF1844 domain-containing protein [candidate division Zixibacteria bacterium]
MTDTTEKLDPYFFQLVLSLQTGAMQQMGKMVSPISGKVERNLDIARNTIDMLAMLEAKMKGNMTEEESKLIGRAIYELRLNYVDESKKGDSPDEASGDTPEPAPGPAADEGSEEDKDDREK